MTTDRFTADRERIAGEMNKVNDRAWSAWEFTSLDCAIRAFEVLCEPRYELGREDGGWYAAGPEDGKSGNHWRTGGRATGDHAADVCRLICDVLDRDGKGPSR